MTVGVGVPASTGGVATWTSSGLRSLTGRPGRPGLDPPPGLVDGVTALARTIGERTARLGRPVELDPLAVLAERAVAAGLDRAGDRSCGGSARLLPADGGWVAVNLARTTDWELVAAWLELDGAVPAGEWLPVERTAARRTPRTLVGRATMLGLPVAAVGERSEGDGAVGRPGVRVHPLGRAGAPADLRDLVVADLSALWAGPLAASILGRAGARVLKVESTVRPDGARWGSPVHYTSLNAGKEEVTVDLTTAAGRRRLAGVVAGADVVVSSARPRALRQLGLDPVSTVRHGRPRLWLAITGYGAATTTDRHRVAFGDDAAAAGGLVAWDADGPCFCADAVADPVTGLAAAAAVLDVLGEGGRAVVEASMADVAVGLAGGR